MKRSIAVVVILFSALFIYILHQLLAYAAFPLAANLGVGLFLGSLFACILMMPFYFWPDRRLQHKSWHDPFFDLIHASLAYINFIFAFVIIRDLVAIGTHFVWPEFTSESMYGPTATLWLLALPFIFMALGTLVVRVGPNEKIVELLFPDLPADLEGFRILHITDLHIGKSLPPKFVDKLVQKSLQIPNIDVVCYTGDILDGLAELHKNEITQLKSITSKLGSYYVSGNHEYYWRGEEALEAFRNIGFHVLSNQTESLRVGDSTLQISGIPDPAAQMIRQEGPDLIELQKTLDPKAFKILLAHQPNIGPLAAQAGFDLQISGHTHGGQFFPWNFLIGFFQTYSKGLYTLGKMQLYVNQGAGYWGPSLRLGTYCELAVIVLKKSK